MRQFILSITFQGKEYQTNVIANKDATEFEVFQLALEQVQRQWGNKKDHS